MKCINSRNTSILRIPPSYHPPPMPASTPDGFVPEPTTTGLTTPSKRRTPGQLKSRPAGAPPATTVYGVDKIPAESVDVAATYEALDAFLQEEDLVAGCAPSSNAPIFIELVCNGILMRALAGPSSGANLMSKRLASKIGLRITPFERPVRVNLEIDNGSAPEVLTHVTSATFRCEEPALEFGTAFFKLANL